MQDVVRFWLDRGVDGFRVDAVDVMVKDAELRNDPPASGPLPVFAARRGRRARPRLLRQPARGHRRRWRRCGKRPATRCSSARSISRRRSTRATSSTSTSRSRSSSCSRRGRRRRCERRSSRPLALERVAWVLSNHDFDRLATRVGEQNVRAAAELLLTLPGAAFMYQGDELGLPNGPGHEPPYDRPGATGSATRCSGTPRRPEVSPPASPGCRHRPG